MAADRAAWMRLLRHVADARRALASGNLDQALTEVEAAVAIDPGFVAAQSLRDEIVARTSTVDAPATYPAEPTQETRLVEAQPSPDRAAATVAPAVITMATAVLMIGSALGGMTWLSRHPALWRLDALPPVPVAKTNAAHRAPSPPATTVARTTMPVFVAEAPTEAATPKTVAAWTSPRLAQLDVWPRWRASAIHVEDSALLRDLQEGVSELWIGKLTRNRDAIFVGASDKDQWDTLASFLKPNGVVWLIYPNRIGAAESAAVARVATAAGFAPVKRLHYSAGYTAEKFVPRRSRH